MRIAVIGAGYVGLTTGSCLAALGHRVRCHDIDGERLARLARLDLPLYEPGLEDLVRRGMADGSLQFCLGLDDALEAADAVFLAVGTPALPDGEIDLSQIIASARAIAPRLARNAIVIVKSTVVPGTCRQLADLIARERGALDIRVASNPEFLREGAAVGDFMEPDRIVIGADDVQAAKVLEEIYAPLARRKVPVLSTSCDNAELVKYAANAFLALKIGFINDIAELCERIGGDVARVAEGIGLDRRIGPSCLTPGPGFGGSCFPKDTRAFAAASRRAGAPQALIETLIRRNEERKAHLGRRILNEAALASGDTVAVLGLAFKAGTDDIREAAALTIIPMLQKAGIAVRAHDPMAMALARRHLADVRWCATPYEAAEKADALVILTEWDDYRGLDLARIADRMAGRVLFDYRNLRPPEAVTAAGLRCIGLGRPAAPRAAEEAPSAPSAQWRGKVAARSRL